MTEHDADLADVLHQFTNLIMNERVRAYNEGLDAERERCAAICVAHGISDKILELVQRGGAAVGQAPKP